MKEERPMKMSIVIPVFNEEESITALLDEIQESLEGTQYGKFLEVIVVNDGSTDSTLAKLVEYREKHSSLGLRIVSFRQNFGQTNALSFGFGCSNGEVVVALDGDGQNAPRDILRLADALVAQEADCVSGWRKIRGGDRGIRVWLSRVANRLLAAASGLGIHDSGCTLKAYKGEVIRGLRLYGDMHRIIPFQISMAGGKVEELEVSHRERIAGVSKYSLARTFRVFQDIIVVFFVKRFLARPMHLLGTVGSAVLAVGVVGFLSAVLLRIAGVFDFVETPILLVSLIMGIGGLQMMGIGLIAELFNRRAFFSSGETQYGLAAREL